MRRNNRHYHIPARTVQLGTLLDLVIEKGQERLTIDEWDGWVMATTEGGLDASPGRARLYLFATDGGARGGEATERGADAFARWHERVTEGVMVHDVPEEVGWVQGRVRRLGYRSDKWGQRGEAHDYDHDFGDGGALPPLIYTDSEFLDDARAAVLIGGDMAITEAGID